MKKQLWILLSMFSCGLFQASDVFKAIEQNNKKEIKAWLKNNPDVDLVNNQGQRVLAAAVQVGNNRLFKQLLKHDVAVNALDQANKAALDYAVELQQDKLALKLVKAGAQVTTQKSVAAVEKVLKRRARICLALSIGLIVFGGLVITAAIVVGCVIQTMAAIIPAITVLVLFPLFMLAPNAASECIASSSTAACYYCNICFGAGILAAIPFVASGMYCAVSCRRWYKASSNVQRLNF